MGRRGTSYLLQYGAAISLATALAFPFVCAMFLLLSFGLGFLAWFVIAAVVFLAPPILLSWCLVWNGSEGAKLARASLWHAWALCLILHLGFSAGLCRVAPYLPNSPHVDEGPFAEDFLQIVFMPVTLAWRLL